MATGLPPPPINDQPGSFVWLEWYRKLRDYIGTNGSVPWYIINFAGSNITDIATRDHDQLQNLDGGTAGEHYHLTLAQWNMIVAAGAIRETVTTNRTYYVRTDGNDSNNGLTNTSGGAFLTIQKAVDVVSSTLDIASNITITIQVADGTYNNGVICKPYSGGGVIEIVGNTTTPSSCIVSESSTHCFLIQSITRYVIKGFKITTTGSNSCGLLAISNGILDVSNMDFGSAIHSHMFAQAGGSISVLTNYTISGGSVGHCYAISGGRIFISQVTVTLTGTPNFTGAYVWMDRGLGMVDCYGLTFSGSATGKRYIINNNSVCFTNGAATTYLPGNVAGTTANGGVYA